MWRSKRPGRMTAGSSPSRSLVAAITTSSRTSLYASSVCRSWFTVRRDSWSGQSSRRWATESNSSKNSTQGTLAVASRNTSSTLRADSPR